MVTVVALLTGWSAFRHLPIFTDHNTTESIVLHQYRDYFRQLRLGVADISRLETHIKAGLQAQKPLALIKQEVEIKLRFLPQQV